MNVLLVKPHTELAVARKLQSAFLHLEPLELEIVAGGVPEDDCVEILDLSLEKNPFAMFMARLHSKKYEIVAFTGYSTTVEIVKELLVRVKSFDRSILTIVGGVHATLLPDDYAVESVDLIVRGEGGVVLKEIIQRMKCGEPLFFDGRVLSPHDEDFKDQCLQPPPVYPQSHEIPLPRRDLVDRSKYFCVWTQADVKRLDTMFPRVASLRTSVGCAFSCSFCVIPHLMNGVYLQRDPDEVVNEIAALEEDYVYFVDDEMFLNEKRVTEIAQLLISRGIKKKYISWARSDTIVKHPEMFRLWKEAGLSTVYVGLESMDEKRLQEYKKRVDHETNKKAVQVLRDIGIMLHASFIVNPDFDVDDFRRLEKDVLAVCPAEVTFTVLSPSPGTAYWHDNKDSFICDPYKFYDCMHTVLPTRLPLKRFYQHFGRLNHIALRNNPLRMNNVRMPFRDFVRAIVGGTKYIFSLYNIYRDYKEPKRS